MAPVNDEERDMMDEDVCTLCGEDADAEMGIFWDKENDTSVYAHAQCGIDEDMPLA